MKIVRTDTATGKRNMVSFDEVCRKFSSDKPNSDIKKCINYILLDNRVLKDGNYEYRKEIS